MASEKICIPNDKSGTLWTAVGHIFCAVVGAGVLGLPNALAWLGWIAGPIILIIFYGISLWSSHLLAQLYTVDGKEFARYHHAVEHILGRPGAIAISVFQLLNLVLSDIAYLITGAIAMQTVANLIGSSFNKQWVLVLVMGGMELVFSQIPSLEEIWWVSALGTVSSLGYVAIALILGLVYSGNHGGSISGRPGTSDANKAFGMLNSLGTIAFSLSFAQVLMEIQDTLKQPPRAEKTMRGAVSFAISAAFGLYLSSAVACYSALGDNVPGEVLEGFEQAPNWVLVFANICIVIHMVMAWQVWAQPVFETIESNLKAVVIKRQLRKAGLEQAPPATDAPHEAGIDAKDDGPPAGDAAKPSPFDVAHRPGSVTHQPHHHELHILPPVAETELSGLSGSGLRPRMSVRSSGGTMVHNSAPLPDLLPLKGWKRRPHGSTASLASMGKESAASGAAPDLRRHSMLSVAASALSHTLGSQAMYHLDTGAACERVPLNDQGYYLPLWQRILIRSSYVMLCTIIAIVVPFFSAITGLIGALT